MLRRRQNLSFKSSVLTAGLAAIVVAGLAAWLVYAKERRPPQPGTRWTDEQLVQAVAPMRAGRRLTPERWPNGAKVARLPELGCGRRDARAGERQHGAGGAVRGRV